MENDASGKLSLWFKPLHYLGRNWLTLAGTILTTSSAITLVVFWAREMMHNKPVNPYAGMVLFLMLPGIFVVGLLLIPSGLLWDRYRLKKLGVHPDLVPVPDFKSPIFLRAAGLIVVATIVNVTILGAASVQGVEYLDSAQFCGQTCHTVMNPEHTAYKDSPHSRVSCVECHIGPGASWFVQSKLSGVRQVFAVALNTYSRPIPSPVEQLRPARETCEQCHWPQKFHGDKFVVKQKYSEDEANTLLTTVLVLKVGGRSGADYKGIHGRHLDVAAPISYVSTDGRRQVISKVFLADGKGGKVEYDAQTKPDAKPAEGAKKEKEELRTMDCVDCHNRPTHKFWLPERAVDRAMTAGLISPKVPFVKKKAVEALKAAKGPQAQALAQIAGILNDYYQKTYPDFVQKEKALLDEAVKETQVIYSRNIDDHMRITWGTHPENIGHEDFPGCFRCHDDNHKSSAGKTITQDCDKCHTILATEEANPKILKDLGIGG
jgi:nitrate/TMAO reductase-like tetraheme cytochrome c subunit